MKNTLILICCLFANTIYSQIVLTRADFPKPTASSPLPDSVLFSNVLGGGATAHQFNGTSYNWDESQLSGSPAYQQFVSVSATPILFQFLFSSSDYAQPLLNGGTVAGGALSDAYEYYDYSNNDSRLQIRGFAGNILIPGQTIALPLPASYSSPDVLFTFPMEYGNKDSSNSGFDVNIPLGNGIGNVRIKRTQKRVNEVDGWGRISVPSGGTYDVLRHVSRINRVDSLITDFLPIGIPTNPIEYRWLAQGQKIPVVQINGNSTQGGSSVTVTSATYIGGWPVSNTEFQQQPSLTIYPNPSDNILKVKHPFSNTGQVNVSIANMLGQELASFGFTNPQSDIELPIYHLPLGTYSIRVVANGQKSESLFQKK